MLGYEPAEVLDRPATDFFFPEDVGWVSERLAAAGRYGMESFELRLRKKDGSAVWVSLNVAPMFDDGHNYEGTLATFIDITERKQAEESLKRSLTDQRRQQAFLETVLNHSRVGIAVLRGEELRYTLVNDYYQAIAPGTQMVGRTYREVFPDAAEAGAEARSREVLLTGRTWELDRYNAPIPGKPDATWEGVILRLPMDENDGPSILVLTWT